MRWHRTGTIGGELLTIPGPDEGCRAFEEVYVMLRGIVKCYVVLKKYM